MRARDSTSINLRNQVANEADAAEQLERETDDATAAASSSRAPPATGTGSRSSFTEQPEPPNYSIEIEHVFKVYGPYAPQITPFFSELWQQHCQSEYATGRVNVAAIRQQERSSQGQPFLNPNAHTQLRMGTISSASACGTTDANSSEQQFISMVLPFFDRMQQEAQDTNQLNARRDEINELSNALRIFAPGPNGVFEGVQIETYNAWRSRYIALMNTPMRLSAARERNETTTAVASIAPSAPPESVSRPQRQRISSPARTVIPEHSMALALQQLQTRFRIRQCGGDGQCTFKVLHVIEFTLGVSRRQLYNCGVDDDHTHTRTRVANWMRTNAETAIIRLGADDDNTLAVKDAVAGEPGERIDQNFEAYCDWIAQSIACGGEAEIACFAAMYAADFSNAK